VSLKTGRVFETHLNLFPRGFLQISIRQKVKRKICRTEIIVPLWQNRESLTSNPIKSVMPDIKSGALSIQKTKKVGVRFNCFREMSSKGVGI
jgi:hypothetical protein